MEVKMEIILRSVRRKYNSALYNVSKKIARQIDELYTLSIERFYVHYPYPKRYDRTYSTYLARSSVLKKNNNKYIVGVIVDPSNIGGKPYRGDTDWVFERTFVKGIHGISVEKNRFNRTNNKYMYSSSQVRTLKFGDDKRAKVELHMVNMHPTPKRLMDIEFKKISGKRNIRKEIDNALKRQYHLL